MRGIGTLREDTHINPFCALIYNSSSVNTMMTEIGVFFDQKHQVCTGKLVLHGYYMSHKLLCNACAARYRVRVNLHVQNMENNLFWEQVLSGRPHFGWIEVGGEKFWGTSDGTKCFVTSQISLFSCS